MSTLRKLLEAASCRHFGLPEPTKAPVKGLTSQEILNALPPRIEYRLAQCFVNASYAAGRRPTREETERIEQLRSSIPTFAATLVLDGSVYWPIDDLHPWVGCFPFESAYSVELGSLRESELVRKVTPAFILKAAKRWRRRCTDPVSFGARFRVLDEFKRVVMRGVLEVRSRPGRRRLGVRWIAPPDVAQIPELEQEAKRRSDNAAFERGWDNFSTAKGEDRIADRLREAVSCARYGALLIP